MDMQVLQLELLEVCPSHIDCNGHLLEANRQLAHIWHCDLQLAQVWQHRLEKVPVQYAFLSEMKST